MLLLLTAGDCIAGLTKVPIDGQPRSIVRELDDMARTYIKAPFPPSVGSSMEHASQQNCRQCPPVSMGDATAVISPRVTPIETELRGRVATVRLHLSAK